MYMSPFVIIVPRMAMYRTRTYTANVAHMHDLDECISCSHQMPRDEKLGYAQHVVRPVLL